MALDRTRRVDEVDGDRVAIEPATGQGQRGEGIASLAPHHRLRPRAQLAVPIIVEAVEGFRQVCAGGCIGRCGQRGCAPGYVSKKRIEELVCPIGIPSIKSKHPSAIAAATAVQLLERDEVMRCAESPLAESFRLDKVGAGRRAS